MINDSKKYQEELNMAKDLFKKALPYYAKKAHEAEQKNGQHDRFERYLLQSEHGAGIRSY